MSDKETQGAPQPPGAILGAMIASGKVTDDARKRLRLTPEERQQFMDGILPLHRRIVDDLVHSTGEGRSFWLEADRDYEEAMPLSWAIQRALAGEAHRARLDNDVPAWDAKGAFGWLLPQVTALEAERDEARGERDELRAAVGWLAQQGLKVWMHYADGWQFKVGPNTSPKWLAEDLLSQLRKLGRWLQQAAMDDEQ